MPQITYEQIKAVNEVLDKLPVKGKGYVQVNERIKGFRQLFPNGCIETEILEMSDGIVTMKATVSDGEGNVLGTGLAQEKESASFINKTSYIENCETSAVGRALGFVGIGVDGSMASADEVANAILQQSAKTEVISKKEQATLKAMVEAKGYTAEEIFPKGLALTGEQYTQALETLKTLKKKGE